MLHFKIQRYVHFPNVVIYDVQHNKCLQISYTGASESMTQSHDVFLISTMQTATSNS